jgi:4-carboxymuconolactone decarboxylase
MEKQTAGRKALGDLAPKFAELNDDVLFGEVWSREDKLATRDRCLITVTALITKGVFDNSLRYHIANAKAHGVTKEEMVEVLTHLAFYAGWPNAWAAFPIVREVYADEKTNPSDSLFGLGEENKAFEKYFIGKSYLKPLSTAEGLGVYNVTFEPGCRNNWHIHHVGGQLLLCTDGEGWYQEWGGKARKIHPGDVVYIAPEIKHWHGATKDSWFTHIAIGIPAKGASNEWCEPVNDKEYESLDEEK